MTSLLHLQLIWSRFPKLSGASIQRRGRGFSATTVRCGTTAFALGLAIDHFEGLSAVSMLQLCYMIFPSLRCQGIPLLGNFSTGSLFHYNMLYIG